MGGGARGWRGSGEEEGQVAVVCEGSEVNRKGLGTASQTRQEAGAAAPANFAPRPGPYRTWQAVAQGNVTFFCSTYSTEYGVCTNILPRLA